MNTLLRGAMSGKEAEQHEVSALAGAFGYGNTKRVIREHSDVKRIALANSDVAHMCMRCRPRYCPRGVHWRSARRPSN